VKTAPATRDEFAQTLDRIVRQSRETYYNPYNLFAWPETLPADDWWMSPELLTVYGTPAWSELDEGQRRRLSHWESVNFYSLNIHGIRELLSDVTQRLHAGSFELSSEFFHHLVGEENEHMWFFAQYCQRYGSKIYPDRTIRLRLTQPDPDVQSFLVFARILIFEEIVDYFNVRMGRDDRLPPIVRQINNLHHQDESRHLTFGRQVVQRLYAPLRARLPEDRLARLGHYLERFVAASIQVLYSPLAYEDAGIAQPYRFRANLLRDPSRGFYHRDFLGRIGNPHYVECARRIMHYLVKSGIVNASTAAA
jgi:para-aminobenzoate N-oxygenase AurF